MFARLFKSLKATQIEPETQRETVKRALSEINGILAALPDKPAIGFEPATGEITLSLPTHMPDEALALPAPETEDLAQKEAA